jgi:hypothetical protein
MTVAILPPIDRWKGDDWVLVFQWVKADGTPQDSTGYTPSAELLSPFNAAVQLTTSNGGVTILDAPNSIWQFVVARTVTLGIMPSGRQSDQQVRLHIYVTDVSGKLQTLNIQPINVLIP